MQSNQLLFWLSGFLCCISCSGETQSPPAKYIPLEGVTSLPKSLNETSGVAFCKDGACYVLNDGGNKARLYKIALRSGEIERSVELKGVKNHDWEEMTEDDDFVYVGDFGNNQGTRDNLMIYKVSKKDLSSKDEIAPDIIEFDYPDRNTKSSKGTRNFDCEAMIAIGDSLYLFSKNRGDLGTDVYRLPNSSGKYTAIHTGHFDTEGLITSAAIRSSKSHELVLLGYVTDKGKYRSFLWLFDKFEGNNFFSGDAQRLEIAPNLQAESVIFDSSKSVLIINEEEKGGHGKINRISLKEYLR